MNIPVKIRAEWAREQLLSVIDDYLKVNDGLDAPQRMSFDDRRALEKERDRIAKLFRLSQKYGGI